MQTVTAIPKQLFSKAPSLLLQRSLIPFLEGQVLQKIGIPSSLDLAKLFRQVGGVVPLCKYVQDGLKCHFKNIMVEKSKNEINFLTLNFSNISNERNVCEVMSRPVSVEELLLK